MTEHTIYSDAVLTVTARPYNAGTPQAQWIVRFVRYNSSGTRKMLDQCAAWWGPDRKLPTVWSRWDHERWVPFGYRLIPMEAIARVETWLEGRPVEGKP